MPTLDVRELRSEFVVHFGVEDREISLQTFSASLNSIGNALSIINDSITPGSELEVRIVALEPGSFRVKLSPKTKEFLAGAWADSRQLVIAILAALIVHKLIADDPQKITVTDDLVKIEYDQNVILIPRTVGDEIEKLMGKPEIDDAISEAFEVLEGDERIEDFGITPEFTDPVPDFLLGRKHFGVLSQRRVKEEQEKYRKIKETVSLSILKAVFERGNRKWEFVWQGTRISAPITDGSFFDKLYNHEIVLGTGDEIKVVLIREQEWNEVARIWVDISYAVEKVLKHTPGPRQGRLGE